ncbi:iron-containing alcohol dehydrogenase family protein [Halalkalibacter oceani]|uniref:iron-containing alcohol dehydrogenase family protein n=1 Tax=Halalkalibacter oceani TaxID=1653776 RepID=UPI003398AD2B
MNYSIYAPPRIHCGAGSIDRLNDEVKSFGVKRLLIVTDKGLKNAGIVDKVLHVLDNGDFHVTVFDETKAEPTVAIYQAALELGKANDVELVIGLGGGSSMDVAKAVSLSLVRSEPILHFVGINRVPGPGVPIITISTTSGTGSEVSQVFVLTDEDTSLKSAIFSPHVLPSVAIIDPELTLSLPPVITAHTGIDAMVHAIEGYLAVRSSPYTDELALLAFEKIWNHLKQAYDNGDDLNARTEMAVGSMIGGMVMNTTSGAGMVHGLAFALGVHCHLSHGLSNSVVLPYVLEVVAEYEQEKVLKLAKIAGSNGRTSQETIMNFINRILEMQRSLDLPTSLKELNIEEEVLPVLAKSSYGMERLQSNSPKRLSEDEILQIFKRALSGKLLNGKVGA